MCGSRGVISTKAIDFATPKQRKGEKEKEKSS
jgi:hypothetical protein